eukprot:gene44937-243_t
MPVSCSDFIEHYGRCDETAWDGTPPTDAVIEAKAGQRRDDRGALRAGSLLADMPGVDTRVDRAAPPAAAALPAARVVAQSPRRRPPPASGAAGGAAAGAAGGAAAGGAADDDRGVRAAVARTCARGAMAEDSMPAGDEAARFFADVDAAMLTRGCCM